jgi:hypothetical protein
LLFLSLKNKKDFFFSLVSFHVGDADSPERFSRFVTYRSGVMNLYRPVRLDMSYKTTVVLFHSVHMYLRTKPYRRNEQGQVLDRRYSNDCDWDENELRDVVLYGESDGEGTASIGGQDGESSSRSEMDFLVGFGKTGTFLGNQRSELDEIDTVAFPLKSWIIKVFLSTFGKGVLDRNKR